MPEMLFYQKAVPLNSNVHRHVRITPLERYSFAAATNSVPLVNIEFAEACKEYPIVFVKGSDGEFMPVVLTGLREQENLFVDDTGRWEARYIPAFVRCYPFLTYMAEQQQVMVCIDETADCLHQTEGMALFVNGKPSPYLSQKLSLLQEYQNQIGLTQQLSRQLVSHDLLVEANFEARLNNGQSFALSGGYIVDEKRLRALDEHQAMPLFTGGFMGQIYAHLISMGNLQRLLDRMSLRQNP